MGTRGARLPSALVCVTLALLAFARGARAEPGGGQVGLELRWVAPSPCPQHAEARERLVQQLRNPPPPDARARVTITATGDDFDLVLQTRSRGVVGERKLSHPNCDELASAAIAMVAWTFDGDSTPSARQTPSGSSAAHVKERDEPSDTALHPRFALGAVGAISTGAFGLVTPGAGVSGRLRGENFSSRLLLAHWFQQTQTAPDGVSVGQVALWTSSVNGCWRAHAGSSWDVCLLFEGGVAQARGSGPLQPARRVTAPWWATGISGSWLLFREEHFRIPLELAGLVPVRESRFVLESSNLNARSDVLFQTRFELRLSVGLEVP